MESTEKRRLIQLIQEAIDIAEAVDIPDEFRITIIAALMQARAHVEVNGA